VSNILGEKRVIKKYVNITQVERDVFLKKMQGEVPTGMSTNNEK
jgi:hypothetical protein